MITPTLQLFLALLSTASAQKLARRVLQELPERSVRVSGGWALLAEDTKFCPDDLSICGSDKFCCPTSMTCHGFGGPTNLCCPSSEPCSVTYQATPYCADDTWTLWDLTQGGINKDGYFCCSHGLVGLLDSKCVNPNTITNPSLEAMAIKPGGGVLSTSVQIVEVSTTALSVTGVIITSVLTSVSTSTAVSLVSGKASSSGTTVKTSSATTATITNVLSVSSGAVVSALGTTTGSSATLSPSPSATRVSDGNSLKGFGFVLGALVGGALFVGVLI